MSGLAPGAPGSPGTGGPGGGAFTPQPGRAPLPRLVLAQTAMELRLTLRRGESLLLTMIIPLGLLVLFGTVDLVDVPDADPLDFLVPGLLALAVLSTAFTGQAIATGYERSYGVLKRLGATALPRFGLLAGKTLAVLAVQVLQLGLLLAVALALGWSPAAGAGGWLAAGGLLLLATAAFSGLALLLAGTLRAEATLAAANLLYLLLLVGGGVVFPLTRFPDGLRRVLELLPVAALADGLRAVLGDGNAAPARVWLVLGAWAVLALGAAAATFSWE